MYTQVGSCPHCGAPIYSPSVWHGITPPPPTYSCACVPQSKVVTTTNTIRIDNDIKGLGEIQKNIEDKIGKENMDIIFNAQTIKSDKINFKMAEIK